MKNLLLKVTFFSICLGSCSLVPRIITPDYAREINLNYQSESTSFDAEFRTLLSNKGNDNSKEVIKSVVQKEKEEINKMLTQHIEKYEKEQNVDMVNINELQSEKGQQGMD